MRPVLRVQAALALVLAITVTSTASFAERNEAVETRPAYVLSEIEPHDREAYLEYLGQVLPIIEKYGGRVVINPFQSANVIEGAALSGNIALIEFPSPEARNAFWNSPEYQPWKARRQASATSRIVHID